MPNQSKRKISGPSFNRMDRQKNMKRVKALRDSGQLKKGNPLSKLQDSIKGALGSLSRKTDSSATRKIEGPKTKRLSSPTAQQAANQLIKAGQGASKPKKSLSPVIASRQRALEARLRRAEEKAKEKELAQARQTAAKSKEPTRRPNESMTAYRQRLAKYRRENK